MEYLFVLWPISGWVCGYLSTPKWMFKWDKFTYVVLLFCGALVGPFGVFWFMKWTGGENPFRKKDTN